ncbi:shikimate kinase [Ancylomarina euxinus]|uniref:Shikimate kinase n=1 Tax=Ancylomarina euxinus TaxID=2283627 RepID=A0A425Y3B8_9BACT|nr:shikimate kinase [Ancylomarina euxinus]MCZ4693237.1 shikimate kinase [Ancylomarina euxinus]MUP15373.1 shikimate kinase [Ancylomarina euxinus]RRG22504.1 shikimate kinase [Ancylomarina euxinus]
MHIFLIGYMGCGKSYWGRLLADSLNYDFIDLDELIEQREGLSIPEIFEAFGESSFRVREQAALDSVKNLKQSAVISTGGGVPCFHNNMGKMNVMGKTLFLEASPLILKQNILKSNGERPIVKAIPENELEAYIANHLSERLPFYQQAQLSVNVNGLKLEDLRQLLE